MAGFHQAHAFHREHPPDEDIQRGKEPGSFQRAFASGDLHKTASRNKHGRNPGNDRSESLSRQTRLRIQGKRGRKSGENHRKQRTLPENQENRETVKRRTSQNIQDNESGQHHPLGQSGKQDTGVLPVQGHLRSSSGETLADTRRDCRKTGGTVQRRAEAERADRDPFQIPLRRVQRRGFHVRRGRGAGRHQHQRRDFL